MNEEEIEDINETVNQTRIIKTTKELREEIHIPTFSLWARGFNVTVYCAKCNQQLIEWGYHANRIYIWEKSNCQHYEIKAYPYAKYTNPQEKYYQETKNAVYLLKGSEKYLIVPKQ
jgi:hypothetical protein